MDKQVDEIEARAFVARAQLGDADAFESVVRDRLETCYATCLSVLGSPDDARDATQDAFVLAWRRLPTLRDAGRFDGWLHAIAMNASHDVLRRRRRLREVAIEDGMGGATEPPTESRVDFEAAVGHLSPGGREVAERYYLGDEPIREISASLGVPVGTIKSRLFHARTALRALLAKE